MDSNYIKENRLVERYLRHQLDEEETAAFEERLLFDPALLAEVERAAAPQMARAAILERDADERVRQGVKDLEADGLDHSHSFGARFKAAFLSPQYALAASFALVVSLGFSALMYQGMQRQGLMSGTDLVPLLVMRGASSIIDIRVTDPDRIIVLLVDPGIESYAGFRVTVIRTTGSSPTPILVGDGLEPGYEELLAVAVPGRLLQPGEYEIHLQGQRTDGALADVSRTSFRVSR